MISPESVYWGWLPHPDLVQHVSFPLFLGGLLCVLLELRYPKAIARAERWVRTSGRRLRNTDLHDGLTGFRSRDSTPEARNGALFLLVVTGVFQTLYFIIMVKSVLAFLGTWVVLTVLGLLALRFGRSRDELMRLASLSVIMGTCIQIVAVYVLTRLVSITTMRLLHYFDSTGGRAIGRIGLGLGVLGLLGEAYQLLWHSRTAYWLVLAIVPVLLGAGFAFLSQALKRVPPEEVPEEQLLLVEEEGN
ncbi:MAG: hypothetical protein ABI599_17190 [Flavobacteriales bacterium]